MEDELKAKLAEAEKTIAELRAVKAVPAEARAVEAAEEIIAKGIANGDHAKTIAMKIVSPPKQQETELRTLTPAGIMRWVNESERKLSKDQTKVGAHTSDAPPVCPKCGSADEMIRHGDGQWVCHATHVVERTCFPPGEGEEWAKAAADEIIPYSPISVLNTAAVAADARRKAIENVSAIILKHAPARPTAAREDGASALPNDVMEAIGRLESELPAIHEADMTNGTDLRLVLSHLRSLSSGPIETNAIRIANAAEEIDTAHERYRLCEDGPPDTLAILTKHGLGVSEDTARKYVRTEFINRMDSELIANERKGDWDKFSPKRFDCYDWLMEHINKLCDALREQDRVKVSEFCADVANIAMKIDVTFGAKQEDILAARSANQGKE